jgi:hypothetical protein
MEGVPSRSKMYWTSATFDVHAVLHVAHKSRVYTIHFAEDIYILILDP